MPSHLGPERVSERRACRVLGQPRNTQRYQSQRTDVEPGLLWEMRLLTTQRTRFGSGRIYRLLTQRDWTVNEKRVHRLWKQEQQAPRKQHRKRRRPGGSENGCVRHRARYKNYVWSYDFVIDLTENGHQLRLLVVIDESTRECLAIDVGHSLSAQDVMSVLQYLFAVRGMPERIRSDNSPELVSKVVCRWLKEADVKTLFVAKGSPWEDGYVESFNGTLRDELLNREIFLGFEEAC